MVEIDFKQHKGPILYGVPNWNSATSSDIVQLIMTRHNGQIIWDNRFDISITKFSYNVYGSFVASIAIPQANYAHRTTPGWGLYFIYSLNERVTSSILNLPLVADVKVEVSNGVRVSRTYNFTTPLQYHERSGYGYYTTRYNEGGPNRIVPGQRSPTTSKPSSRISNMVFIPPNNTDRQEIERNPQKHRVRLRVKLDPKYENTFHTMSNKYQAYFLSGIRNYSSATWTGSNFVEEETTTTT